ncbi:MAG: CotH kinase family protein [Bacteroidales bacterium]|nr:CotH kinase family protein [Bacteroidales bacterium]
MKNVVKGLLSLLTMLLFLFTGCNSEDEPDVSLSSSKQMLTFKFEASNNSPNINKDITSKIFLNNIDATYYDSGINKSNLIATFTHNGIRVTVDGIEQKSGVSKNDFSKKVVYVVEAEDGSKNSYTVNISMPKLEFVSFKFLKEKNPFLSQNLNIEFVSNKSEQRIDIPNKNMIATFETGASKVLVNNVEQKSGVSVNDFTLPVKYTLFDEYGFSKDYVISFVTYDVPQIIITTENRIAVTSKDVYLNAEITVNTDEFEAFTSNTTIKGRGNSTWGYPKKPYKIKFAKGEGKKMLGMKKARSWVMLANYQDPTLMLNAVAFKIGRLLDLPFTNHAEPFDLTLNGVYMGSYMLTEQVEIDNNRVDIDEENGVILELDTYFDETWKFKSPNFNLPVMVKDPDVRDQTHFDKIKSDFEKFENAFASSNFPNSDYLNYIDAESLVGYLIAYNLTQNNEINHPKSTFMFKDVEGKYFMGPIWDFDWGFDYEQSGYYFGSYTNPLFLDKMNGPGKLFFSRFIQDPVIKELYKSKWAEFKISHLNELYDYIDEYANKAETSFRKDANMWPNSKNYISSISKLKVWVKNRVSYVDSYVAGL